jgi:hypothetical protein
LIGEFSFLFDRPLRIRLIIILFFLHHSDLRMQELDLPLIVFVLLLTHNQVLGGLAELILQVANVPFHLVDRFLELGALDVMLLLQHV